MKKATKIWLITAALLVLAGGILFAGIMAAENWDFGKLSTVRYVTNTYPVSEPFRNLSFETDTVDIVLVPSDDGLAGWNAGRRKTPGTRSRWKTTP